MLSPEERRQRILAKSADRLAKIRDANRSEKVDYIAPVSTPAPEELLNKTDQVSASINPAQPFPSEQPSSSLFSSINSAMNMFNSFSSPPSSSKKPIENTREMILVDKQHLFIFMLGILVRLVYAFYISTQANLFFLVFATCCIGLLTSRYYIMQMKHRTNILITTAMLSGFKPEIMKKVVLIYTLVYDGWIIFSFYFVPFCLTHVVCSLIKSSQE